MKLQYMIVIFIAVVLPISLVLSYYTDFQIKTMVNQVSYDTKLTDATHDAAVALHTNIMNNGSQATIYNVMRANVLAATNIFMNSIATSLGVGGYSEAELEQHIPAIVYTMYDGYYIYTPYKEFGTNDNEGAQRTLKPYVYYTKKYTGTANGKEVDIVVNYTLDNYIAIYGKIGNESIAKSGYLVNPDDASDDGENYKYKGYNISVESNDEVFKRNKLIQKEIDTDYEYEVENNLIYDSTQTEEIAKYQNAAINYYKESKEFTEFVNGNLGALLVDGKYIFKIDGNNNPENDGSIFNQERTNVIKSSIEDNLKIAISNFNQKQPGTSNYRIPELEQKDWDVVFNNFSVVAYLEGIKSGFKVYNSYAVSPLASNNLYVNKNDIYFKSKNDDNDKYYHRLNCNHIDDGENIIGYPGYNFTKVGQDFTENNKVITKYFYFKRYPACYYCAINNMNCTVDSTSEIGKKYLTAYYTALARERQLTYKTTKRITDITANIE